MGKQGVKFGFDKKKELESFRRSLNDPGMKEVERKLSAREFDGELIRNHSRRVGKAIKRGR